MAEGTIGGDGLSNSAETRKQEQSPTKGVQKLIGFFRPQKAFSLQPNPMSAEKPVAATAEPSEPPLDLDEEEQRLFNALSRQFDSYLQYETAHPPLFMAPFWDFSLHTIYNQACIRKQKEGRGRPTRHYEDAFSRILHDYFEPAADSLDPNDPKNKAYHDGRTDSAWRTKASSWNDSVKNAMKQEVADVIFGQTDSTAVYESVTKLANGIQAGKLKDYTGLYKLLAQWPKQSQDEEGRIMWAIVCAGLPPYFEQFLLSRPPSVPKRTQP